MDDDPLCDILARPAPDALEGFMLRWHGLVAGHHSMPGADRLPGSLRRFYEAFGTAPAAFLLNRLLAPAEVSEEGGFTVFYVEEQAVWLWGIANEDLALDDPPVWCRENDAGKPWLKESPAVSVFLVQMVVMSAALNGPHAATSAWLAPEGARRALASLRQLDLPPWRWPGHPARWYAGADAVAFTCPNTGLEKGDDPSLSVWVGSLTEGGVRFIEPHLSDGWDYYSPHDG